MNIKELENALNKIPNLVLDDLSVFFKDNVKIENTSFPIIFDTQLSFDFCYQIEELNINKHCRYILQPYSKTYFNKLFDTLEFEKYLCTVILTDIESEILNYFKR